MKTLIALSIIIGTLILTLSISFFILMYAFEETEIGKALRLYLLAKVERLKDERQNTK